MAVFKNAEERQAARERRSREKIEAADRRTEERRDKRIATLKEGGVIGEDDDTAGLSDEQVAQMHRDMSLKRLDDRKRELKQRQLVRALGVIVKADGTVCDITWGRRLGALAGAQADITTTARVHRGGAAVSASVLTMGAGLGPAGALVGLSRKSVAIAVIVFADGSIHQHRLDGTMAIQQAQVAVLAFNTLAQSASGAAGAVHDGSPESSKDAAAVSVADEITKLAQLHEVGVLTDDEFAAGKKQILGLNEPSHGPGSGSEMTAPGD